MNATCPQLRQRHAARTQRGVTAVEFALVASLFFMLLFGMIEFGRVLFIWNSATEATRLGARIAAVCDLNDTAIQGRVHALFPMFATASVSVSYAPPSCTVGSCETVTVSMTPQVFETFIPWFPTALALPSFASTLSVESLTSVWPTASSGTANPVCVG